MTAAAFKRTRQSDFVFVRGHGVVPQESAKRLRALAPRPLLFQPLVGAVLGKGRPVPPGVPQLLGARVAVVRIGRELAAERGLEVEKLFGSSLSGDVARLEVLRRARRECRAVPTSELMSLLEELLP